MRVPGMLPWHITMLLSCASDTTKPIREQAIQPLRTCLLVNKNHDPLLQRIPADMDELVGCHCLLCLQVAGPAFPQLSEPYGMRAAD